MSVGAVVALRYLGPTTRPETFCEVARVTRDQLCCSAQTPQHRLQDVCRLFDTFIHKGFGGECEGGRMDFPQGLASSFMARGAFGPGAMGTICRHIIGTLSPAHPLGELPVFV